MENKPCRWDSDACDGRCHNASRPSYWTQYSNISRSVWNASVQRQCWAGHYLLCATESAAGICAALNAYDKLEKAGKV